MLILLEPTPSAASEEGEEMIWALAAPFTPVYKDRENYNNIIFQKFL